MTMASGRPWDIADHGFAGASLGRMNTPSIWSWQASLRSR
jgi:hypothetical protein